MYVRLTPEAEEEADEAADWYAAQDEDDLDVRFLAEVTRLGRLIGERPHAWSEIEPGIRRGAAAIPVLVDL